jgi:hypothetical protein
MFKPYYGIKRATLRVALKKYLTAIYARQKVRSLPLLEPKIRLITTVSTKAPIME